MTNRLKTEAGRMRAQAAHFTLPFTLLTTVLLCATAGFAFLAAPAEVEAAEATETAGMMPMAGAAAPARADLQSIQDFPAAPGAAEGSPANPQGTDWWTLDVWTHPKRPFLYYNDPAAPDRRWGEEAPAPEAPKEEKRPKKKEEKPEDPDDFSRFSTTAELRAEADRRLSDAVMTPTEENVRRWMAINSFIQGKAQRFTEAFTLTRYAHPEYDWTSTHPTVNAVVADMAGEARAAADAFLKTIAKESGLIFAGASADPQFRFALPIVHAFARSMGFEVLFVSDVEGPFDGRPGVVLKKDNGILGRLGVTKLPALLLVAAPGAAHPALRARAKTPRLLASGVVSGEEMKRRILQVLAPEAADPSLPVPNDAVSPTLNADRMLTGEAYRGDGRRGGPEPEALADPAPDPGRTDLPARIAPTIGG